MKLIYTSLLLLSICTSSIASTDVGIIKTLVKSATTNAKLTAGNTVGDQLAYTECNGVYYDEDYIINDLDESDIGVVPYNGQLYIFFYTPCAPAGNVTVGLINDQNQVIIDDIYIGTMNDTHDAIEYQLLNGDLNVNGQLDMGDIVILQREIHASP